LVEAAGVVPPCDARRALMERRDMELEIHYADDWAALYKDGKLERVGDSYLAEERALELLGVAIVQDNAFMRGQDYKDGVAKTLEEIEEFARLRDERKAEAAKKFAEAERLFAEARALEGQ
jgi:hypothetical protein